MDGTFECIPNIKAYEQQYFIFFFGGGTQCEYSIHKKAGLSWMELIHDVSFVKYYGEALRDYRPGNIIKSLI